MMLKTMKRIDGKSVAILEAHGGFEIFRIHSGKALNHEFHEDYIGSLSGVRSPRDTTPLLDIERAFKRMGKIALRDQERLGEPLILIVNAVHLLYDNEEGRRLLELIQQHAGLWTASNLVSVVLNSNDCSTTERLMWQATRLRITSVRDVSQSTAAAALKSFYARLFQENFSNELLQHVYD